MEKTAINNYQLRKAGFKPSKIKTHDGSYLYWKKPIPNKHQQLAYSEEDKSVYFINVYSNHLRKVKYMEQIMRIYDSITK